MAAAQGNIIVIGGKGGVGKTATAAILTQLIAEKGLKLLLIDADPAVSVAYTLGIHPRGTLGDFREDTIENHEEASETWKRTTKSLIRDLIEPTSLGFDILTMGKAESQGCFCGVNDLLCFGIESMCKEYDWVLIDCEAGLEQVNRRAVHHIDKLVLVSDTSLRGIETVASMLPVAEKLNHGRPFDVYVVANRIRTDADRQRADKALTDIGLKASVYTTENDEILTRNASGQTLVGLSGDNEVVQALRTFLNEALLA